jgi:hypothetical protein
MESPNAAPWITERSGGIGRGKTQVAQQFTSHSPNLVRLANGNRFVFPAGYTADTDVVIQTDPIRRRPVPAAVPDLPGFDTRPDPARATTSAELVAALADFCVWAGDVSYRQMAERSGQLVSSSTLQRALTGKALPSQNTVIAVITGCGGDEADKQRFVTAWRRIRQGRAAGGTVSKGLRVVPSGEVG